MELQLQYRIYKVSYKKIQKFTKFAAAPSEGKVELRRLAGRLELF
jgi:hypothetical protein